MTFWEELASELNRREAKLLRRTLQSVPDGALDLASNDYLGLSRHPEVIAAAQEAAARFGAGAGASRLVSGHFSLVEKLESALADFKQTEAALVFSSGYAANGGVILALSSAWPNRAIFSHKRNHASIQDACWRAAHDGRVRYFRDEARLRVQLEQEDEQHRKNMASSPAMLPNRKIIIADAVFSMDGDLCDLPALLHLAREFDALLLLDDAHGTGTLGASGRGTSEHFGLHDERIIHIGTLSKALGSQGGFVAGPRVLIDFLVNTARPFIYSTGLNPPAVGAALKSLEIIAREPQRIETLRANARFLAENLSDLGFEAPMQPSPILPVIVGDEKCALELSHRLLENGLWCRAIRPPTVPVGSSRLRIGVSAGWSDDDLARIIAGFAAQKINRR
ncbi:MAG: 8-amino-7-oxononanoate synthase [Armatimonadetes bacterium]|nr:8-amino-7-oxononanoate synthase [Armatimonadota bacterium]